MQGHRERIDRLDELVADVRSRGIAGCYAEDERSDGRHVRIGGRDLVNFASCSYLGLELGTLTPLFVIFYNLLWGLVTASWLKLTRD